MRHAGAGGRALLRVEIELGGSFACDGRGRVWRVERGSDAARPLYAKGRAMSGTEQFHHVLVDDPKDCRRCCNG